MGVCYERVTQMTILKLIKTYGNLQKNYKVFYFFTTQPFIAGRSRMLNAEFH